MLRDLASSTSSARASIGNASRIERVVYFARSGGEELELASGGGSLRLRVQLERLGDLRIIREIGRGGSVPELAIENIGKEPVVVFEGEELMGRVLQQLPFSRPWYDEDQFTDRSERFLAAELVREQLMLRLHQELPYALTVEIEEFKREGGVLRIGAIVWVERKGQKQIVIGKGGDVLKQVGSRARHALQELFEEKIFLRMWVKVSRDWSDNERALKQFGYED